jgi:hypothetical protein
MSTVERHQPDRPIKPEPLTRADVLTATEASALLGIPRIDALRLGAPPGTSGASDRPALDLQEIPAQPGNSASIRGGHVVATFGLKPDD